MPLIGGGGAANTAGGNPAGTGTGLNYVRSSRGNYAYAYSGAIAVPNAATTLNLFTTGSEVLVMQWVPAYVEEAGDNMQFRVHFNDENSYQTTLDSRLVGSPFTYINFIIPPYTTVKVTCENKSGSSPVNVMSNFTGEVI
jgi:hypothetical protein